MEITKTRLANGMRLLHIPVMQNPSTTIMVLVNVGSRYENKENAGISHFIEHMIFKGTQNRPTSRDIGMDIEKIGGSSNAFTSYDYTGFYIKVPSCNTIKSLEIIADMISNSTFPEQDLEKEKGVVIEEIRMYNDQPTSKVVQIWNTNFFGDNGLGRDIAGSIESVASIDRRKIQKFLSKYYILENMILVVAGDADLQIVKKNAGKYFAQVPSKNITSFRNLRKIQKKVSIKHKFKDLEQSHLVIGGYGYPRDYKYKFHLQLFDAILSKGFGSRLFQKLRDQMGLAYYLYSSLRTYNDIGTFQIGLGVENSKIEEAIGATMEEFKDLLNGNFDEDEFIRAKNFMLGNIVTDIETSDDFAMWYGLQELLLGKSKTIKQVEEVIQSLNKEDVLKRANEIFRGQQFHLALITPHKKPKFDLKDYLHIR